MQRRTSGVERPREPGLRARLAVVVLAGLTLAGCGTATPATTRTANDSPKPAISQAIRTEQSLHAQVLASLHAPAPKGSKTGVPGWIPRDTLPTERIVTATPSHPQLAIQGISVQLDLPSGSTLATLNGPLYNNKYVGSNDPAIPAQFVLSFSNVHGTIPIADHDFTILDQFGNNLVPEIQVKGGGALPKQVAFGQTLTLVMGTIIPAGDGSIAYNPTGFAKAGHKPLVGWDFIVEDD